MIGVTVFDNSSVVETCLYDRTSGYYCYTVLISFGMHPLVRNNATLAVHEKEMQEANNRSNATLLNRRIVTRLLDGNRKELDPGAGVGNADVGGEASNVEQLRCSQPPIASQPSTDAAIIL